LYFSHKAIADELLEILKLKLSKLNEIY